MRATVGIAMLAVGFIITIVGAVLDARLSTALYAAGLLLMVGDVVLLEVERRQ